LQESSGDTLLTSLLESYFLLCHGWQLFAPGKPERSHSTADLLQASSDGGSYLLAGTAIVLTRVLIHVDLVAWIPDPLSGSGIPVPHTWIRDPRRIHFHGQHVYYCQSENDRWIVPYHPPTSLIWNAHMNAQYVTSSGLGKYLTKYVVSLNA
jgi:hypothetical protein